MGAHLSEPVTEKDTHRLQNDLLSVASSAMQGWRITMEDAHSNVLKYGGDESAAFLAVFDGHGGSKVAKFASEHLHQQLLDTPAYKKGDIKQAIKDALLEVDEELLKDGAAFENCGTTAVLIVLKENRLYCGNVGDSRAIASRRGEVVELSHDHKPSNPHETERILAAGGFVEFNRVNGNLALSRALGDFAFKRVLDTPPDGQIVSAVADIIDIDITPDLEFAVIACDGIWDVLKNDEVVDFVRSRIAQKMDPGTICEKLLERCLAPDCHLGSIGCDNMTALIACFLHNGSYDDLAKKCQIMIERPPEPKEKPEVSENKVIDGDVSPNQTDINHTELTPSESDADKTMTSDEEQQDKAINTDSSRGETEQSGEGTSSDSGVY
ncbi:probable protein phosphatase 2C T23F11.1 [Corticium candelabrum]|uniref:probable protein phosphatase 2C T23F11.1 n=1 Tax=Corticium candelabrum TaxID=121492 RepID=UPI002E25EF07|nr:probable protein phosphatase 2C T23F11.1 [Corticium candelabrum]